MFDGEIHENPIFFFGWRIDLWPSWKAYRRVSGGLSNEAEDLELLVFGNGDEEKEHCYGKNHCISLQSMNVHMEVSKNMGVPKKRWMIYFMENPTKMDDD